MPIAPFISTHHVLQIQREILALYHTISKRNSIRAHIRAHIQEHNPRNVKIANALLRNNYARAHIICCSEAMVLKGA